MGKFNKNEKWNKKDARQAVLIKQREKRGGAKKTGKKREQGKQQYREAPLKLFNVCPCKTARFVRLSLLPFFFTIIVPDAWAPGYTQEDENKEKK